MKKHAVIMSAGRGSRMGAITENLPKAFVEVNGKTIFQRQVEVLSEYVDSLTLVLGHGFRYVSDETCEERLNEYARIPETEDFDEYNICIFGNWDSHENAGSFRLGIQPTDEDEHVIGICGDVLFTHEFIADVLDRYERRVKLPDDVFPTRSAVTAIEGEQDEMTGVKVGESGDVIDYGAVDGSHQETGVFILHPEHRDTARVRLGKGMEDEWFPFIFQDEYCPSRVLWVDEEERLEINTVQHLIEAKEKVEKWESRGQDTPERSVQGSTAGVN